MKKHKVKKDKISYLCRRILCLNMLFRLIMPFKYLIILLVAFAACTVDSRHRQLAMADAVMESAPDSAMTILAAVDTAALSQSDYAYYCLLYTQGQIKTWTVLQSDSLFHVAYDAFRDHSDSDLRRRAYFYNAQIEVNRCEYQSAMSDILTAYEIAKSEHNDYWLAKSAEMIGDIFCDVYNFSQAEVYTSEAVSKYKAAGRELNHRYALCDLAVTYSNEGKKEEGLALVDSLRFVIENEHPLDSALMGYLIDAALPLYFTNNRHDEICTAYENYLPHFYGEKGNTESSVFLSHVYQEQNELSRSIKLLDDAMKQAENEHDRVFALYAKYYHACNANDYKLAASFCDSLLYYDSRIVERAAKESVTVVQRDFYNQKSIIEKRKAKTMTFLFVTVLIFVIIIVLFILMLSRLKIKTKNVELANQLSVFIEFKREVDKIRVENQRLNDELQNSSSKVSVLQQQLDDKQQAEMRYLLIVEQLFRDKWTTFNNLCNNYFVFLESGQSAKGVLNDIDAQLKEIRNPKNLQKLEESVDRYLGGVMTLLRVEVPGLKNDDIVFLSLIFAGFSVRAICLILDIKYKNFYLRKSRLVKRISNSEAPQLDLFLKKLAK